MVVDGGHFIRSRTRFAKRMVVLKRNDPHAFLQHLGDGWQAAVFEIIVANRTNCRRSVIGRVISAGTACTISPAADSRKHRVGLELTQKDHSTEHEADVWDRR